MKHIVPRLCTLAVVLPLLALAGSRARAGGFTIIEFGARKTGMMTSVANPDDLSAVYHNPGALGDMHGTRFHMSTGVCFLDITARLQTWDTYFPDEGTGYLGSDVIKPDPLPRSWEVDEDGKYFADPIKAKAIAPIPLFAVSTDFGFEKGPVVALSIYVPDAIGADLPKEAPTKYMVTDALFVVGMASISVGYRLPEPVDWLSLGFSLGLLYTRLEGKRWHNQHILFDVGYDYIMHLQGEDYYPFFNFGIIANPIPQISLGLTYIAGANLELEGNLEISLPPDSDLESDPLDLVGTYKQTTHMKVPHGLAAGISWQVIDELELAADYRHWFYRTFKYQDMYHDIELMEDNPIRTPKNFKDSKTFSLGAMVSPFPDWLGLDFMAGWTYDWSPAPSKTKSLDTPTVDLTGFSLGARYTYDEHWRLTLTYYRYWYLKDTVEDSILIPPQNSEFWGTVDTVSLQLEITL